MPRGRKDPYKFNDNSPKVVIRRRGRRPSTPDNDYEKFYQANINALKMKVPFLPPTQLNSMIKGAWLKEKEGREVSSPRTVTIARKRAYSKILEDVKNDSDRNTSNSFVSDSDPDPDRNTSNSLVSGSIIDTPLSPMSLNTPPSSPPIQRGGHSEKRVSFLDENSPMRTPVQVMQTHAYKLRRNSSLKAMQTTPYKLRSCLRDD